MSRITDIGADRDMPLWAQRYMAEVNRRFRQLQLQNDELTRQLATVSGVADTAAAQTTTTVTTSTGSSGGGGGGSAAALAVNEDGVAVVAVASAVNVIEPDDTIVTNSPAGTARVDLSKYFLFNGRPGFQFGTISLDNVGAIAGTLLPGGHGAFVGGGFGAVGADLLLAPSFDLTNPGINRSIAIDIPNFFGAIIADDASILNLVNISEYHVESSTHDIVLSGFFWGPTIKFGAGLTHDCGLTLFACFATLTCDVDVAPGPNGLDDLVIFLNHLSFVPTNGKTLNFKHMSTVDDIPEFDPSNGDIACLNEIVSVHSQPRIRSGGYASPHIPARYGLWFREKIGTFTPTTDSGTIDESYAVYVEDQVVTNVAEAVHSAITAAPGKSCINDVGGAASFFKGEVNFGNLSSKIDTGGFFRPATSADVDAPINSVYYSLDSSKLVYKDFGGVVNDLY